MVKITNYTKAEVVEIQRPPSPTNYIYELGSKKHALELIRIMEAKQEVEVIKKEYR